MTGKVIGKSNVMFIVELAEFVYRTGFDPI